ncbi:MFS transporter [Microbacterium sp. ASV49]|uniref:MFS transporter n=1 Tax=Microbacterium candidum TaxID=3041922 RepID=A0ABT7MVI5_9MICO|nr:MFS transporter [Microbacterium sp. ASV49]MDL9978438.1 MFS transporter [Microbacterium sp. ASV49]
MSHPLEPEPLGTAPTLEEMLAEPVAAAGIDEVPGSPQPRAFLTLYVLAWFGLTLSINTIIGSSIPKLFAFTDDHGKGIDLSVTAAIGGIVVMVITPLFGRLSDRTMARMGKRRPWILWGTIVGCVGIVVLAFSVELWVVVLGWVIVQAGFGATNVAVHALLADQIATRIRARVSAFASAAGGIAGIVGAVLVAAMPNDKQWTWFIVPGFLGAIFSFLLFFGLHDIVRTDRPARLRWSDILSTYWLDPVKYRDFFWAWMCRLLVTMSIVSVAGYLLFFIIDRLGIPKEQASGVQAGMLIMFTVGNILMTLLFGWISDRTGRRKPIVLFSSLLSAVGLVIALLAPDITVFTIGIVIVGAAQGAYVSVDVALMTEVLPTFKDAGKDLGIVSLSFQLPQLLVPLIALPLLSIGGGTENYSALFIAAIVFGVLGGLAVIPIKTVR